jgi:isopenicillin-N epimerase
LHVNPAMNPLCEIQNADSLKASDSFGRLWPLRHDVVFLNHGSFGSCPTAILEQQAQLRRELEREPVDFLVRKWRRHLEFTRAELARFIGADPDDLAFTVNATAGVNAVLRSLTLQPGDELLTTNHAYGACRKTLEYVANRTGAKVTTAQIPLPIAHEDEFVKPILSAVTDRTRLALIDHVSSPTALVFPLERIVPALSARGVDTLIDGAHAPGMVPINIDELGATYYAANTHKWLCAPKGSAFLFVRRDRRHLIHPNVISHGYDPSSGVADFRAEFDWTGTLDPTPWLLIPECIRYLGTLLQGGWDELIQRNHDASVSGQQVLCHALDVPIPCPPQFLGSMASVPLPELPPGALAARLDHEQLSTWFREHGIEIPFFPWPCPGGKLVRISTQLYNTAGDIDRLIECLRLAVAG